LAEAGVQPLHLTLLGVVLGMATAPLLAFAHPFWALLLLLLSGYCDTLDGSLARYCKTPSHFGAALDIFSDRLVEFCIILGLYCVAPWERGLLCLSMLGAVLLCITSFLVVGIFVANSGSKSFYYSPGLMERTEAFACFVLMILLPQYFTLLAFSFIALVSFTAILRLLQFRSHEQAAGR
jgi:phosphatidylglycerophosphate synthase